MLFINRSSLIQENNYLIVFVYLANKSYLRLSIILIIKKKSKLKYNNMYMK